MPLDWHKDNLSLRVRLIWVCSIPTESRNKVKIFVAAVGRTGRPDVFRSSGRRDAEMSQHAPGVRTRHVPSGRITNLEVAARVRRPDDDTPSGRIERCAA